MDKLFVAYKPPFITSNGFLKKLKWQNNQKDAGFSGILDPFAKGVLIVAFGKYTKLFRFLKKTPKTYKATLYLGAYSETLDLDKIEKVQKVDKLDLNKVKVAVKSIEGKQKQLPPKYSAKRIDGKRAYELVRKNKDFKLKESKIEVFQSKFLNYSHPFLSFEATVSEGTYIRVLGQDIAEKLGCNGALTFLERTKEGEFHFEDEKSLDPMRYLDLRENFYLGDKDLDFGPKLKLDELQYKDLGFYYIRKPENTLRIIEITEEKIKYTINGINL
ncbi:MAG: tRNA pseudouridine(55) synthase TruB [Campylobacterales bacterium]|nr:tRNA pseudouridine(55) synthase TruB [Campylobacterales bacterium]